MTNLNSGSMVLAEVTDIYSFGVLATHKITGTKIFVHVSDIPKEKTPEVGKSINVQVIAVTTKGEEKHASAMI
jgi:predicted RNA-binding protein with RPS1 domain